VVSGEMKAPFLQFMIPTNALFESMPYETNLKIAYCMVAFIFIVAGILIALVASRGTKRLSTDT
jgi:preprotein translocase subunit SecG